MSIAYENHGNFQKIKNFFEKRDFKKDFFMNYFIRQRSQFKNVQRTQKEKISNKNREYISLKRIVTEGKTNSAMQPSQNLNTEPDINSAPNQIKNASLIN